MDGRLPVQDVLKTASEAWPLVGRADELALILESLEDAATSNVVIAGPAGIGKTRLARETGAALASHGTPIEWVTGFAAAKTIPLGAFAHLVPSGDASDIDLVRLFGIVGDRLRERADDAYVLLVIDDAHSLDHASATLVHQLARTPSVRVLATVRTEERASEPIVALWKDEYARRIEIQALSRDETAELLANVLGHLAPQTRDRLYERTGGNALFLRELVTGSVEEGTLRQEDGTWRLVEGSMLPSRLLEIVGTRFANLSDARRRACEVIAQCESLDGGLADALVDPDTLAALERDGIVASGIDGNRVTYSFTHPVYAETIRAMTPAARAAAVTRHLADALERTGARRPGDLLRLAGWRLIGGGGSAELMLEASRRAAGIFEFSLAVRCAQAAVDAGGGSEAAFALAEALALEGEFTRADAILTGLENTGSGADRVRAVIERAQALFWTLGRGEDAHRILARAHETCSDAGGRDEVASVRALFRLFEGAPAEAAEITLTILDRPDVEGRAELQAGITAINALTMSGRCDDSLALIARLLPVAEDLAHGFALGTLWLKSGVNLAHLLGGRLDEAEESMEAYYVESREGPDDGMRGLYCLSMGAAALARGRLAHAHRLLSEATDELEVADPRQLRSAALGQLALCDALLGETVAADEALALATEIRPPGFRMDDVFVASARVWALVARGERTAAVAEASRAATDARSRGQLVAEAALLHDLVRLNEARTVASRLADLASTMQGPAVAAYASHADAAAAGDASALDLASTTFASLGMTLLAAEASVQAATAHRHAGRAASAHASLHRAREIAGACSGAMTPLLRRLDDETPMPLTDRELEIGSLAARGVTSTEIAERLVISRRTVENHLHRMYAKLHISGRHELAAALGLRD